MGTRARPGLRGACSQSSSARMARMKLFFDDRDDKVCEERGDRRLYWLDDLGAEPFSQASPEDEGFLFAGGRPISDYKRLVAGFPLLRGSSWQTSSGCRAERGPSSKRDLEAARAREARKCSRAWPHGSWANSGPSRAAPWADRSSVSDCARTIGVRRREQ